LQQFGYTDDIKEEVSKMLQLISASFVAQSGAYNPAESINEGEFSEIIEENPIQAAYDDELTVTQQESMTQEFAAGSLA
jgi:hypothetical protein